MDLHSILNDSDSDDEQYLRGDPIEGLGQYSDGSGHVDLEQILRDDDDDEDDDIAGCEDMNSSKIIGRNPMKIDCASDDQDTASQHFSTGHSAEDWAVLQALLGEDHEETEVGDDDWMHASDGFASRKHNVDAILLSDNDDDSDNVSATHLGPMTSLSVGLPPEPPTNVSPTSHIGSTVGGQRTTDYRNGSDSSSAVNLPVAKKETPISLPSTRKQKNVSEPPAVSATIWSGPSSLSKPGASVREVETKVISDRALEHAQAYERKLLRSGHRDIVSPLMVKRRLKQKIIMSTRAHRKSNYQSGRVGTTSAEPRFGFSGVLENRTMNGVAKGFRQDNLRKKGIKMDVGLPTALAVNSKFIALGTQNGIVLVFDLFEVLKQVLNPAHSDDTWNSKQAGSITSIDLNMNDEVLVAGYTSGFIVLWDTIRGVVLRTVCDTHPSPITSVRFLSDLKMLSVDAGGLVNKLTFTKTMLWSTYSMETECLLDGTAGQILAMNVQPPVSTVNPQVLPESAAQLRKLVLVALSSERSSFAVAVEPTVNVLHRWAKPPADRMNTPPGNSVHELVSEQTFLPCLAWGWAFTSGGGNVVAPILARAWGCCVQLLLASLPSSDEEASQSVNGSPEAVQYPSFGLIGEFDIDDPVVALEWLNDRSLAYLTVTSEFCVVDTVTMTLIDRLDFSPLRMVYAEFSLSRSMSMEPGDHGAEPNATFCSTFQNSIRSSDHRLLVLCQDEVKLVSMVGAKKRIAALEEDGEWLEALAAALDHYESTVSSLEDRKRSAGGRKDLSKHPEFISATKNEADEWISRLLLRYLNLAVDNAPESPLDEHGLIALDGTHAIVDLAQSHFQMLAGVCVEFCLVTRRLDLLFGQIFRRFQAVGFTSVFLDVLEPYVLNDKLSYIAPEAMAYFVDHCKATNGIATVERCLLHMDVRIMDFHSILALLKNNQMYSALFYVMNQGLDDYVTPLEFLLDKIFDASDDYNTIPVVAAPRRSDGAPETEFERLGYKAILYIQSCFRGKAFPKESDISPPDRLPSLRSEVIGLFLREEYTPSALERDKQVIGKRALQYPYTRILLDVDARALLDSIAMALDAPDEILSSSDSSMGSMGASKAIQKVAAMLSCILLPDSKNAGPPPAKAAVNAYLDFLASYLMKGLISVEKSTTFKILSRMAERFSLAKGTNRLKDQRKILDLLTALPRKSYDSAEVLRLVDKTGINRAALLLHQEEALWEGGQTDPSKRSCHFSKAIDCYLRDDDVLFRREVFEYVKKECAGTAEPPFRVASDGFPSNSIRESLFSRIPDLVQLDPLMTAELVAELFVEELQRVVELMDNFENREAQFTFFQAIIGGDLHDINPVAGSVLNAHLAMEHHHKYLSLMAQLHPDLVYGYLSTHDNYRAEECLTLCQEQKIADASAYLLERMGHVASALQLILQTLESRMMSLKRTIRGMGLDERQWNKHYLRGRRSMNKSVLATLGGKQEKEVQAVKRLLVVALDMCERNSRTQSSASDHGSQLWFNVLDRLINAKGFLRLSKEKEAHALVMSSVLGELLRMAMQRMVSSVPLTDLVRKVTSDHSGSRLGELREMMESLLSTYGFELKVFSSAVKVYHFDVKSMHSDQRSLKLEGTGVSKTMEVPSEAAEDGEPENVTAAVLEKTSQSGCPVLVSRGGDLSFADNENMLDSRKKDGGLADAMSRLRSRRGTGTLGKRNPRGRGAGIGFAPDDDQTRDPEDAHGPLVGQLGEAEHRGRLMSFM
ncbi:vacuolar protein sorting 8 homolog (Saccharomyces cerevisiae) [Seminavis robusta]|uniref:Vacuolar protein sorting 8 homolog (Saccharomyces cerevisiae) n=1 Tax=Seminavis robusta TaxID=568900 RepID=A0A9N8DVX7_9STRA|nr:vacuolar protein sorting 8 homolog (Saccharomyces cerevisiae) [Seminavis robusta]|eukprot:Sro413_g138010.1 vacuolar protein sorting 8 homolog (Saccharomyces cerevisiae) (1744) ;mRNA; f:9418-14649